MKILEKIFGATVLISTLVLAIIWFMKKENDPHIKKDVEYVCTHAGVEYMYSKKFGADTLVLHVDQEGYPVKCSY